MGATRKEGEWPDQQVNVFFEPDTREALNAQLKNARERENGLLDDVRRFYREDTPDHALAKLVAAGAIKQTPFRLRRKRLITDENGVETLVRIYSGKAKAAVLFTVTNRDQSKPWNLLEARLVTIRPGEDPEPYVFGDKKPFALRADRDEIAPGESGNVAVIVDRSAFKTENGNAELILEIYRKEAGGNNFSRSGSHTTHRDVTPFGYLRRSLQLHIHALDDSSQCVSLSFHLPRYCQVPLERHLKGKSYFLQPPKDGWRQAYVLLDARLTRE